MAHKGQERECLLYKKRAERIDRWYWLSRKENSKKSNSICYQKIRQYQQESHLWHLGEWASFSPLPISKSVLNWLPENHTHSQLKLQAPTASYFHFLSSLTQALSRGNSLHVCDWSRKDCWSYFLLECCSTSGLTRLRSPLFFCGQLKIDLNNSASPSNNIITSNLSAPFNCSKKPFKPSISLLIHWHPNNSRSPCHPMVKGISAGQHADRYSSYNQLFWKCLKWKMTMSWLSRQPFWTFLEPVHALAPCRRSTGATNHINDGSATWSACQSAYMLHSRTDLIRAICYTCVWQATRKVYFHVRVTTAFFPLN